MKLTIALASLVWMLLAIPALAQQKSSDAPIVDWLTRNEIQIRKTFDGKSKDESEAARFSYSDTYEGGAFWLVDLAVKFSEWDMCADCTGKSVIFYPILEWHKSTSRTEATNKLKVGPSFDILLGDLTRHALIPIILVKATYERDYIKDLNSGNFSGLIGLMGANKAGGGNTWLPMSHINDKNGILVFRYAPYVGIEHFNNLAIEKKGLATLPAVSLTDFAAHLQADLYLLRSSTRPGSLEFTVSAAYRRRLGGDNALETTLKLLTVSANLYFDAARHFAIGADYEDGRNPRNNFNKQKSKSVAFKVKF